MYVTECDLCSPRSTHYVSFMVRASVLRYLLSCCARACFGGGMSVCLKKQLMLRLFPTYFSIQSAKKYSATSRCKTTRNNTYRVVVFLYLHGSFLFLTFNLSWFYPPNSSDSDGPRGETSGGPSAAHTNGLRPIRSSGPCWHSSVAFWRSTSPNPWLWGLPYYLRCLLV